jgi:hypothetical protein
MALADSDPAVTNIQAARLWAGGFATAVVAALVAVVGVLVATVVDIDPVSPEWLVGDQLGDGAGIHYAWTAFLAALAATALLHLLLLTVPRPRSFFRWIVGLTTVAAVTLAFTRPGALDEQIAAGAITAAIGIAIGSLLSGVAVWSAPAQGRPAPREGGTELA